MPVPRTNGEVQRDAAVVAYLLRIADALDEIAGTLAAIYQDSKKAEAQDD